MANESKCLKCGAPLTPGTRDGVCPKCLLPPPGLAVAVDPAGPFLVLSWSAEAAGHELEATDGLSAPNWTTNLIRLNTTVSNGFNQVTVSLSGGTRFFRLRNP